MTQNKNRLIPVSAEGILKLSILDDCIAVVEWDDSVEEINANHLIVLRDLLKEMGNGQKIAVLFPFKQYVTINNEARNYAVSKEGQKYTLANAVVVNNLAKKILFNFFLSINKPTNPTKGFDSIELAVKWLKTIIELSEEKA